MLAIRMGRKTKISRVFGHSLGRHRKIRQNKYLGRPIYTITKSKHRITLAKPYERSSDSNLIGGLPAEAIFMASGHRHTCKAISDMWDCRQSKFIIL
jgi:hypothetical protein